ncbi:MAG: oligosaccharide flippase family protein [Firmicutes bacterium]|nr:oligosaccharide flippase family protein [Bacillota bacterium]
MKRLYKAVLIVTVFTLIDRVLGFGFKIYLSRELGAVSVGIYQVALSMFFVLLTFTTSGTPLVVSKMTALFRKKGDTQSEFSTVAAALVVGLLFSCGLSAVFFIFREPLGNIFAARESMNLLLLLLPGVMFSGVYAAFRGNMWGRERYVAVSVIELIEQTVRIFVCVLLIMLGFNKLRMTAVSMSVACGVTAIACMICYFKAKGKLKSPKGHLKPLIKQALPVTMIRASNTLVASLIGITIPFLLQGSGHSLAGALAVYGTAVGMALPLLYLPVTAVGSLAYVMIPSLSSAYHTGDKKSVKSQIESAIIFSLIMASLFMPMLLALGEPIGVFIYGNADAGRFLAFSAWLLIPIAAENIISSMMNSLGLEKRGFINYIIGAALMFAIMFAFWGRFRIEILSITLGIAWTFSTILDIIAIKKRTGIRLSFIKPLIKCICLIVPSTFLTSWLYTLTNGLPAVVRLLIASCVGTLFFALTASVFGVINLAVIFRKKSKKYGNRLLNNGMQQGGVKRAKRFKNKKTVV